MNTTSTRGSRNWASELALHEQAGKSSNGPMTQAAHDALLARLDAQAAAFQTDAGRIEAARIAAAAALSSGDGYRSMLDAFGRTMDSREIVRVEQIERHTSKREVFEAKRTALTAERDANLSKFASEAGQIGLVCDNPGDPESVRNGAYKIHGITSQVPMELPAEPLAVPEKPTPPEAENASGEAIATEASTTTAWTRLPKRLNVSSFLFGSPMEAIATVIVGALLSLTAGQYIGILNEAILSSKRIQPQTISALLLGVVIIWLTGTGYDFVFSDAAKPTEKNSASQAKFRNIVPLIALAVLCISYAEISAGAHGIAQITRHQRINNAYEAGGKPSQDLLRGDDTVPLNAWIGALLISTPFFVFKSVKGWKRERQKIEIEQADQAAKQHQREAEQAAYERLVEQGKQELRMREELVKAHQEKEKEKREHAAFINNYFRMNTVAKEVLELSFLIQSSLSRLAELDVQIAALDAQIHELELPIEPDQAMLNRLQDSYQLACSDATKAYELAMGNLNLQL